METVREHLKNWGSARKVYFCRPIDEATHTRLTTDHLHPLEMMERFGDWYWCGAYTTGFAPAGGFEGDVWILRPVSSEEVTQ